jgi:transcriptional regulator with GAF, ATPase, and Fis domain
MPVATHPAAVRSDGALVGVLSEIAHAASETLDLTEVFQKIAQAARRVIRFDAMTVTLETAEGFQLYTIGGEKLSEDYRRAYPRIVPRAEYSPRLWEILTRAGRTDDLFSVLDEASPRDREMKALGLHAMLRARLREGPDVLGYLSVLSLSPAAFTEEDEARLAPIADLVGMALAHARQVEAERERRRRHEALEALIPALAQALDVRQVFDQVSAIAQQVLPHDRLALGLLNEERTEVRILAYTGERVSWLPPSFKLSPEDTESLRADWDFEIIGDIEKEVDPHSAKCQLMLKDGIRSSLRVPIRFEGKLAGGLVFHSRKPYAFREEDVEIARRVADQIRLALSHQRLAEEARRVAEARAEAAKLEKTVAQLTEELASRDGFSHIVGESRWWKDVLVQAMKVAATSTTVLLTGESGTGKEIVARAIHRASPRSRAPFAALNCAALPDQLLESELFGYEKGAFTGAAAAKPGRLELAAGGVLFLDEAGEMSPAVQAKLLRVLEEREFQRLGGIKVLKADVRVISATNRDLKQAIAKGEFREDLYYRLGVFEIRLPPLRERPEDILPLTETFLAEIGPAIGHPVAGISREARELLFAYPWPGNVRELRNALERAAILCEGGLITAAHLPISISRGDSGASLPAVKLPAGLLPPGGVDLESVERSYVKEALRQARGNKSKAAKLLGLTRAQLYSRIEKYGLDEPVTG